MLEEIRKDFEKLVALYEGEREQRMRLARELESSRAENETQRKRITDLEREVDNLKLTEAFTGSGDNSAAKEKIGRLIKEMDRCISLLEK